MKDVSKPNELCCLINTNAYCKGCGVKYCKECFNETLHVENPNAPYHKVGCETALTLIRPAGYEVEVR